CAAAALSAAASGGHRQPPGVAGGGGVFCGAKLVPVPRQTSVVPMSKESPRPSLLPLPPTRVQPCAEHDRSRGSSKAAVAGRSWNRNPPVRPREAIAQVSVSLATEM